MTKSDDLDYHIVIVKPDHFFDIIKKCLDGKENENIYFQKLKSNPVLFYNYAHISKQIYSNMNSFDSNFTGVVNFEKNQLLAVSLALHFTLEQTNKFLGYFGFCLSPISIVDVVVYNYLSNNKSINPNLHYDIDMINYTIKRLRKDSTKQGSIIGYYNWINAFIQKIYSLITKKINNINNIIYCTINNNDTISKALIVSYSFVYSNEQLEEDKKLIKKILSKNSLYDAKLFHYKLILTNNISDIDIVTDFGSYNELSLG